MYLYNYILLKRTFSQSMHTDGYAAASTATPLRLHGVVETLRFLLRRSKRQFMSIFKLQRHFSLNLIQ